MSDPVRGEARRLSARLSSARDALAPAPDDRPQDRATSLAGLAIDRAAPDLDALLDPARDRLAALQSIVDDLAGGGSPDDALTSLDALAARRPGAGPR